MRRRANNGGYTVPSEVEQHFDGRRNAEVGPGDEVELRHRARFVRLQVLQVEASNQVFVAPNMLGHEVHLHAGDEARGWRLTLRGNLAICSARAQSYINRANTQTTSQWIFK